jgi:FkbM family methyltransferase
MYSKVKRITKLILEGSSLADKIRIIFFLLGKRNQTICLKNKLGAFFCRPNSADLWCASDSGNSDKDKYFVCSNGLFLDIGSNIGRWAIFVAKENPLIEVYAFEPEPSNFISLKKNIALNKLKNIVPNNLACGSKTGQVPLFLSESNTGGHSLAWKTKKKIQVKSDTVDSVIYSKNKIVSLVKIDVEGAELDVLKGLKKILVRDKPKLIIESYDFKKIMSFLKTYGYSFEKISNSDYYFYVLNK